MGRSEWEVVMDDHWRMTTGTAMTVGLRMARQRKAERSKERKEKKGKIAQEMLGRGKPGTSAEVQQLRTGTPRTSTLACIVSFIPLLSHALSHPLAHHFHHKTEDRRISTKTEIVGKHNDAHMPTRLLMNTKLVISDFKERDR